MELIEGPTLAELLARGALPLHDALRYAIDIATALDRAHRQGIVHRDLKPGNIMITKTGLKLLDFGLARLEVRPEVTHDAPTIVNPITTDGMILGTLQYMSPEQLEGQATDARTDIFSFGCILYEMVTGRRAFSGGSQASIISAIMTGAPPAMATLAPVTPPLLERLVKKCLAKSADDRWQSAGDLATELLWLLEEPAVAATAPRSSRRSFVPWIVALLAIAAAIDALSLARMRKTDATLMRLTLPIDAEQLHDPRLTQVVAVSPVSDALVYVGVKDGKRMLWYRPFTATTATPIPNTDNAMAPTWSPDGRSIAFIANNQLRRTTPKGDEVTTICDVVPRQIASMAWGEGQIVFLARRLDDRVQHRRRRTAACLHHGGIGRRSDADHSESPDGPFIAFMQQWSMKTDIFIVPPQAKATAIAWMKTPFEELDPRFSPDGKWMAYCSDESGRVEVYVARFDKPSERVQVSIGGGHNPSWRRDGKELYYINDNKLYAATIQTAPSLDAGKPQLLFSDGSSSWDGFDAMPDGQRFLITRVISGPTTRPLNVIVNWQQLLTKR